MESTDNNALAAAFEQKVQKNLIEYLQGKGLIDARVPECPDVEDKWGEIARAYLPDGAREFTDYPIVSLGWMMFVGMALAYYWDTDWMRYAESKTLYEELRDMRGYDNMDEYILDDVLGYKGDDADRMSDLAAQCASRVYSLINHEHIEPGTPLALQCYLGSLHALYLAGMALQLNQLGYHMKPLGS